MDINKILESKESREGFGIEDVIIIPADTRPIHTVDICTNPGSMSLPVAMSIAIFRYYHPMTNIRLIKSYNKRVKEACKYILMRIKAHNINKMTDFEYREYYGLPMQYHSPGFFWKYFAGKFDNEIRAYVDKYLISYVDRRAYDKSPKRNPLDLDTVFINVSKNKNIHPEVLITICSGILEDCINKARAFCIKRKAVIESFNNAISYKRNLVLDIEYADVVTHDSDKVIDKDKMPAVVFTSKFSNKQPIVVYCTSGHIPNEFCVTATIVKLSSDLRLSGISSITYDQFVFKVATTEQEHNEYLDQATRLAEYIINKATS